MGSRRHNNGIHHHHAAVDRGTHPGLVLYRSPAEAVRHATDGEHQQSEPRIIARTIRAENEMAKTTLVAFRLDNDLLKRIDAFAKRLEEQTPGIKLARADAVRAILFKGLDELENEGGSGKKAGLRTPASLSTHSLSDFRRGLLPLVEVVTIHALDAEGTYFGYPNAVIEHQRR